MSKVSNSTSISLLLLHFFSLSAGAAEARPETPLEEHVAEMFQTGFARGAKAFQDSQRLYDSLRIESHNDPRIDYAHGLILLKLLRHKEAKADFLLATKRPGTLYPPAWQALIWSHIVAREFDDGYDRLVDFAKALQQSNALTHEERRAITYWIGQAMAALELGLDSVQSREMWMQTESKLLERIGAELVDPYNAGKEDVYAKHLVLEADIKHTRDKEKLSQGKKLEEIGKSLDAAETKRESLKKSAVELKEEFDEQSTALKKQMERMEKEYALVQRRSATLLTQMLVFDQQINVLQNGRNNNASVGSLAALQSRRALLDTEFQLTVAASNQLSATAEKMMQERNQLAAQYEQATGDIDKEDAGVKKWKERAVKHAEELKKAGKKPVGPATPLNAKIQAATTFRTYVDLDLALERENVQKSFAVTNVDK